MTKSDKPICGASAKHGDGVCRKSAGWGTDHLGYGQCKYHGGSTPNSILNAAQQMATVMGIGVHVEPHEAILQCIRMTAGEVMFCNQQISELAPENAIETPIEIIEREGTGVTSEGSGVIDIDTTETRHKVPMLSIWIRARAAAMDRLAKYSKMALDAGVNERRVQVAESMAGALAPVLRAVFAELELTDDQRVRAPAILRRHLTLMEGEGAMQPAIEDTSEEESAHGV